MANRKPGRPLGSINRATLQWSSYIGAQYGSPLEIAARTGAMSLADIATEVGCDRAIAAELRRLSWEYAAKYTHSEMPRAVAIDTTVVGDNPFANFFAPQIAADMMARLVASKVHDNEGDEVAADF